ncbi:MAG: hypothetical protein FJW13_04725 [Actinobacteria bacterium]|nr:hypothetical protein [Actinomycetota bacterium]
MSDDWNEDFDPRSDARERALNVLFEADVRGDAPSVVVARIQVPLDDLTSMLINGVTEHRAKIDSLITTHSHAWTRAVTSHPWWWPESRCRSTTSPRC